MRQTNFSSCLPCPRHMRRAGRQGGTQGSGSLAGVRLGTRFGPQDSTHSTVYLYRGGVAWSPKQHHVGELRIFTHARLFSSWASPHSVRSDTRYQQSVECYLSSVWEDGQTERHVLLALSLSNPTAASTYSHLSFVPVPLKPLNYLRTTHLASPSPILWRRLSDV